MDEHFNQEDSIFSFKKEFNYYFFFWPIFLVSFVCFLAGAYIYLRYSTPIYQAKATIQVKSKTSDPSSFLSQSTQTMFNFRKLNIDNDIAVLTSRLILSKVVEDLDLQTRVNLIGNVRESLIFNGDAPFSIEFLKPTINQQIYITTSNDKYVLSYNDLKAEIVPGEIIQNEDFIFYPNVDFNLSEDLRIQRIPLEFAVASLQGPLSAEASTKLGDNISISITGPNKKRNEAIVNSLIKITQSDQIQDKQQIYSLSIDFIENRLNVLTQSLDSLNLETVSIKADNLIFTPEAQTTTALSNISKIEDESFKLSVQLDLAGEIKRNLESSKGYSLLPSNVGIENVSVNQLIGSYNELVLQREKLLTGATERNPLVEQLSSQLSEVKGNILQSVKNYISSIRTSISRYDEFKFEAQSRLSDIPLQESELRAYTRNYQLAENLYLFLLQKKEEASISYISALPNLKVIDYANSLLVPISPKKNRIFLLAFLLAFILPFGVLYLLKLLDSKVHSRDQIEKNISKASFLGEIPFIKDFDVSLNDPRSIASEASRVIRSNLNFILPPKESDTRVITVTSSMKGEGKTFTSYNISLSYSLTGKKVLLVGADLRNPQLHSLFGLKKNIKGLTDLIVKKDGLKPTDVIRKLNPQGQSLDVLFSGAIPPNPAELLDGDGFSEVLNSLKASYDVIIIDSAPLLPVSDTLGVLKHSDSVIFTLFAHKTDQSLTKFISSTIEEKNIKKPCVVLNGIKSGPVSYYKYGYGYRYAYNYKYNYGYGYNYSEDN